MHWNIFHWLCEINQLREKPHQNSGEDGKGCTAVTEIALFIDGKLLDQPDPLVKPHSKIKSKSTFPPFCCKGLQTQIPKALRRSSLTISYGKYTQNNFLGHYSNKTMLSAVIRKQGERLEAFMQIVFWIPNSIMEQSLNTSQQRFWGAAMALSCTPTPPSFLIKTPCLGTETDFYFMYKHQVPGHPLLFRAD